MLDKQTTWKSGVLTGEMDDDVGRMDEVPENHCSVWLFTVEWQSVQLFLVVWEARSQYYRWFQELKASGFVDPEHMFLLDEV